MTVKTLAIELSLWERIITTLENRLPESESGRLLTQVGAIKIRRSRAVRSLGAYVSGPQGPLYIRLQFAQEPQSLRDTLLHEVAHACDHLCSQPGRKYRRGHGPNWRDWAEALGIRPEVSGQSDRLAQLHAEQLKVVAVCRKCGAELRRLRRLNRKGRYLHSDCGGRLQLL